MADSLHNKRLSLDTNVLLDIAAKCDFAVGFKNTLQAMGYSLHCTPAVLAELNFFAKSESAKKRDLATEALGSLVLWDISPIALTDVQKSYRKNFMSIVEERSILPRGEFNDARILADTAISEIPVLVTSDTALLEADSKALGMAFNDA